MSRKFVRFALAALFLWAAYAKAVMAAGGPTIYEQWLEDYPSIRYALPAVEAALGVWLLVGVLPRSAAVASMALVSAFSGLLILEIFKQHPKPCACMGPIAALYEPAAIRWSLAEGLGRNVLMIAGCAYLYLRAGRKPPGEVSAPVAPAIEPATA